MSDVRGCVDGLEGAYVVGWSAPDENGVNRTVTICDENGRRLASARAARFRADLVALGLSSADFAFRIPILKPLGVKRLHVMADGVELAGSPLDMGPAHVDCDVRVVDGCVDGWIIARAPEVTPPVVTVRAADGRIVATARSVATPGEDPLFTPWKFRAPLDQSCFGASEVALACAIGETVFARLTAELRVEGVLEILSPRRCAGWLMSPDAPRRRFRIAVAAGEQEPVVAASDVERHDVLEAFPELSDARVGFDVNLPASHDMSALAGISIRLAGSDHHLFDSPYVAGTLPALVSVARRAAGLVRRHADELGPDATAMLQSLLSSVVAQQRTAKGGLHVKQRILRPKASGPAVTIVVPVYRDVAVTTACLDSILRHRDETRHRLLIVNDKSPDPAMATALDTFARAANVVVRSNATNQGFIRSVNRGLSDAACQGDVVLLNSDTRVFTGWLDELIEVARSSPLIGTVTALSNNATIFSYPHPDLRGDDWSDIPFEELAGIALRENRGLAIDVPTGHGFCLFIKEEALREVGLLDEGFGRGYGEENDFCARAADLGFRHVAAGGVLVEHRESVSFTGDKSELLKRNLKTLEERYPEYSPTIIGFERQDGLRGARWALDAERLRRARAAGPGYAVTVINWVTGGTIKAMEETHTAAGLDKFGAITVKVRIDGVIELSCASPLVRAVFARDEIAPLFSMLADLPVEVLMVHQTLGFTETFLDRLARFASGRNAIYYGHDYYPLCPRVTMIDAVGGFCDVAAPATCVRCVAMGGAHEASALDPAATLGHRARYESFLQSFRLVIVPSESAGSYYRRAFPGIQLASIPHPEDLSSIPVAPRAGTSTDIVIIGAIGPHKGSQQLLDLARHARITNPGIVFHVVGYTDIDDQLLAVGNVRITGPYQQAELPHLVAAANGRFALFLQAWPETYSYTLSEAICVGLIPIVPDIGAPADRVRATGFGHVFPFPIRSADIVRLIDNLADGTLDAWSGAGPTQFALLSDTRAQVREAILGRAGGSDRPVSAPTSPSKRRKEAIT